MLDKLSVAYLIRLSIVVLLSVRPFIISIFHFPDILFVASRKCYS